jgi:hypothetical protein
MMLLTRLLLDWPERLPFLRLPPLVARVIQILNKAAVEDTQGATARTNRLRSELAYTDVFGRRWPLATCAARSWRLRHLVDQFDALGKDTMSKHTMSKNTMSKDTMGKDAMRKDTMAKDSMKKDEMNK